MNHHSVTGINTYVVNVSVLFKEYKITRLKFIFIHRSTVLKLVFRNTIYVYAKRITYILNKSAAVKAVRSCSAPYIRHTQILLSLAHYRVTLFIIACKHMRSYNRIACCVFHFISVLGKLSVTLCRLNLFLNDFLLCDCLHVAVFVLLVNVNQFFVIEVQKSQSLVLINKVICIILIKNNFIYNRLCLSYFKRHAILCLFNFTSTS